ncbi:hypothetical protein PV396_34240 [Streptomyces sp. ME02-8801-2C]|uniref:hypothetical protein n=1 Tax=Streptomyces sp. ME02-8801-2C TaxID=3028680 RepID=UPI0029B8F296|nr:hypothetical protein [Streptomyces sp. ME02-8801-2C]MDX3456954.1 hypothetical protein [Streptomyces sp. ME02-8801-2C]
MTTNPVATCGTTRASLFYRAPILSKTGACSLPKGHKDDHQDAKGARWNVIPLVAGPDSGRGRGQALPHTQEPPWTPETPFRSPRCVLGQHPDCQDSEPRDTGVPGVRYLVCTCTCHHRVPAR